VCSQNVEDLNEDIRKHAIDKGTKILKHLGKKAQVLGPSIVFWEQSLVLMAADVNNIMQDSSLTT